jgi:hypothetical protein
MTKESPKASMMAVKAAQLVMQLENYTPGTNIIKKLEERIAALRPEVNQARMTELENMLKETFSLMLVEEEGETVVD